MSQIIKALTSSGPIPPIIPTTFVEDSGSATPAANILNVLGSDTTANNDNGISTSGSGNTVSILLTNRGTASLTTSDNSLQTLTGGTFALSGSPGVYIFDGNFIAYDVTDTAGGVYGFQAAIRTTGGSAVEISTEYKDVFEEAAMSTSDIFVSTSANNVLFQVQGITGKTINWSCVFTYRLVS